jgi:hypothetical protein
MADLNNIKLEANYYASGGSFWDNFSFFGFRKKDKSSRDETLRILFIDDNKFPIIDSLKKAGYTVELIRDITRIDDLKVKDAHIIFVDYKGVGKNLSQAKEGIGVCKMLKETYGESKYIILSTGENIPNGLIQEVKSASDEILSKNSETSEFIKLIEVGRTKIRHEVHS